MSLNDCRPKVTLILWGVSLFVQFGLKIETIKESDLESKVILIHVNFKQKTFPSIFIC